MKSILILLIGLTLLVLLIHRLFSSPVNHYSASASSPMSSQQPTLETLKALGTKYLQYKGKSSHFTGGEWNDEIDPFDSPKHKVMKELGILLGRPGTKYEEIVKVMGEQDDITYDLNVESQSPSFVSESGGEDPMYVCYYWRGRHDFLYFKILPSKEEVIESGWHSSLE